MPTAIINLQGSYAYRSLIETVMQRGPPDEFSDDRKQEQQCLGLMFLSPSLDYVFSVYLLAITHGVLLFSV